MTRLGDCEKCPLNTRPVVSGYGPKGGLAIVGEAPGAQEARRGRPFVGDSGALLRQTLRAVGVDPDEVYMTNAVVRHPPGNKTPGMTIIRNCQHRLMEELAEVRPTKILTVGGVALTAVLQASRVLPITKMRGRAQWIDVGGRNVLLVPTLHPSLVLRDPEYFRDFANDIQKWIEVEEPEPDPVVETIVAWDLPTIEKYLDFMGHASAVSCDLETSGFNPKYNALYSIGFGVIDQDDEGVSLIIPREVLPLPGVKDLLWEWMWAPHRNLVFHNAKFDLQFLMHYFGQFIPKTAHVGDTMLLHYLLDERPIGRYLGHGLKDLARVRYDVDDYRFDFAAFYEDREDDRDYEALYRYQGLDTYFTIRLFYELLTEAAEEFPDQDLRSVLDVHAEILAPATVSFAEAEYHGTYIDRAFFEDLGRKLERRLDRRLRALRCATEQEDFNPGSPPQVNRLVDSLGYKGRHPGSSVDREALEALIRQDKGKRPHPRRAKILRTILGWRVDSKVLQTYVTGLLEKVDPDGRIRPDFQLAGTATGRLSCRNPNFQNIPAYMAWKVRRGFAAPPGYVFMEADYSQLELRVAAWLSEDPDLIDVFASGKDIHMEVATTMFNKPPDDISSAERYMAKRVDFGILYGRSPKALAEGAEMDYLEDELGGERWTQEQAEMYVKRFLDGYPRLRDWMRELADQALRDQYVDTPLGRRRRFPFVNRAMVGHLRRQAVNTPIQSIASDLCLTALTRVNRRLEEEDMDAYILFSVHDSIALEVAEGEVERVAAMIREEMTQNLPIETRGIPFPCDIEVGPNWNDVEKMK